MSNTGDVTRCKTPYVSESGLAGCLGEGCVFGPLFDLENQMRQNLQGLCERPCCNCEACSKAELLFHGGGGAGGWVVRSLRIVGQEGSFQ